jgi:hypothetical protein
MDTFEHRYANAHLDAIDMIASKAELFRAANTRTANNDGRYSGQRAEAEIALVEALLGYFGSDLDGTLADLRSDLPDTDQTPCHKDLWAQRGDPRESGL